MKFTYLTLDTETCGGFGNPLVYDIGYCIHDNAGNIFEKRSYVVREIFYGEWEKMKTAYYADKIPFYRQGIKDNMFVVSSFWKIRNEMLDLMRQYKVKAIIAYNAKFDVNALNCTLKHLTQFDREQTFFPEDAVVWDTWHMACQTVLNRRSFFKDAVENDWRSECGNCKTSAEVAYRHLIRNMDFIESHTALEDAIIEVHIFVKCIATHQKMTRTIVHMPWKIPQPAFHAYQDKVAL